MFHKIMYQILYQFMIQNILQNVFAHLIIYSNYLSISYLSTFITC